MASSTKPTTRRALLKEMPDFMAAVMETICAESGAPVHEMKLTRNEDGWLLMLKARSASRGALVTFIGGRDVAQCFEHLSSLLQTKPGIIWKPDKFAQPVPKDRDKPA